MPFFVTDPASENKSLTCSHPNSVLYTYEIVLQDVILYVGHGWAYDVIFKYLALKEFSECASFLQDVFIAILEIPTTLRVRSENAHSKNSNISVGLICNSVPFVSTDVPSIVLSDV